MRVILAQPRGFCAGVVRAIEIVDRALQQHGAPVYVRHEIVHNRHVVDNLRQKGARFVEELDEVPQGAVAIFSAHGVAQTVERDAEARGLDVLDATCPLVTKVHVQGRQYVAAGRTLILIGHAGHPEVEGTIGQIPGKVLLVQSEAEVEHLNLPVDTPLAYVTQTTLSVDDTTAILEALKARFPAIRAPRSEDICYATSNRQAAVKLIAPKCDLVLVIGAPNSSNSLRLVEVAERCGTDARLIQRGGDIDPAWLEGAGSVGITAGASAPEALVREVVEALGRWRAVSEDTLVTAEEKMIFKLPRQLVD